MIPLATSIPGSSNNGYVAAAYIVFFAIVLIYVAIMALRLTRVERSLRQLNERAGTPQAGGVPPQDEATQNGDVQDDAHDGQAREREAV
jgi:flagellar biosynthesis/type III secretory pathway M-ring protein FliF/YscJ